MKHMKAHAEAGIKSRGEAKTRGSSDSPQSVETHSFMR